MLMFMLTLMDRTLLLSDVNIGVSFQACCHRKTVCDPHPAATAYCVEGLKPLAMKAEYKLLRLVQPVTVAVAVLYSRLSVSVCNVLYLYMLGESK